MGIGVPRGTLHVGDALAERVFYVLAVPEPLPSKQFPAVLEPRER